MRIGVITVHKAPNYGANLQAYATWKFITNNGHYCEILDMSLQPEGERFPLSRPEYYQKNKEPFRIRIKLLARKILVLFGVKKPIYIPPSILPSAQRKFNAFNELINYSSTYNTLEALYSQPPQYDVYLTGSDQVWNPTQHYCLEPFFLTFVGEDKRKLSYAASIGIEELRENEKKQFAKWLSSYEAISVREKTAKNLLEEITGRKDIEQVIDPTFLLSQTEWNEFAIKPNIEKPFILVFTLGHNWELIEYALKLRKETYFDVKVVCLMALPYDGNEYESITDACPRELIGYISQAELVLTDSFHGTAFSILMKAKNFYTYLFPHAKRNSRMIDLLELMGLSDHIINNSLSESFKTLMSRPVNHVKISAIVDSERNRCGKWLMNKIMDVKC